MRYIIVTAIIAVCLVFSQLSAYADDSEMQLLVEMLVENGSLTREQAQILTAKAKEKAARQAEEKSVSQAKEKAELQAEQKAVLEAQVKAAVQSEIKTVNQAKPHDAKKWEISDRSMQASWNNGILFETADGNFKAKIGGRIYADTLYATGQSSLLERIRPLGDFNRRNDQAFIRSARLGIEGTIYRDFFYKLEYEFAGDLNNKTEVDGFRGAYMGMEHIPYVGTITIGQFKEPFGLEELGSHNDTTFLERSLANIFAPGYSWGVAANNTWFDERVTFTIGGFRNSVNSGTMASGNEWCLTTRATCLPWYVEQGKLMHLGAAYSYRIPESGGWNNTDNQVRYRSRPELYTRDFIVDTGNIDINSENRVGLEGAVVYGSLSLQGELMQTWINAPWGQLTKTGYLYGGYGYISYILTGEHRKYDKSSGEFRSVEPKYNFSLRDRTWGAWELAARLSYLNLNDKSLGISGGTAFDTTFGLNWYLNPNMRLMVNYVHADRAGYGSLDGIQARAQVNFD